MFERSFLYDIHSKYFLKVFPFRSRLWPSSPSVLIVYLQHGGILLNVARLAGNLFGFRIISMSLAMTALAENRRKRRLFYVNIYARNTTERFDLKGLYRANNNVLDGGCGNWYYIYIMTFGSCFVKLGLLGLVFKPSARINSARSPRY